MLIFLLLYMDNKLYKKRFILSFVWLAWKSSFQIRIRSDPNHLAGSGSTSGNMNPVLGSKTNCNKLIWKSTKIIRKINQIIRFFFIKEITFFVSYAWIIYINYSNKKHCYEYYTFLRNLKKKNLVEFVRYHVRSNSTIPGSRSADPDWFPIKMKWCRNTDWK